MCMPFTRAPVFVQNKFVHCDQPLFSDSKSEIRIQQPPPPDTMTFPPTPSSSSFDSRQSQFELKAGVKSESSLGVPTPLETLHEIPIPPFLSKTYELVDDPSLDYIISWGEKGCSFVVWEPVEFARMILPRNFKHNNFSSFVRQLNTYGFRKIDADKWEFANEGFVRGQRHLLKIIQRRRSHQLQQFGNFSGCNEPGKAAVENEIIALRKDRSSMRQEVVELQHEQRGTCQHIEAMKDKLEGAERRQKQMVSFLAQMFENPAYVGRISQLREQKSITSPRTSRKFVKHQLHELGNSSSSPNRPIVKCQPELSNFTVPPVTSESDPVTYKQLAQHSLQDIGEDPLYGAEYMPSQVEDPAQDELAMVNELLHTKEKDEWVPNSETTDPLLEQRGEIISQLEPANESFISSLEGLVMETSIPEFSISGTQSMVTEDVWSMGFEAGAAGIDMSSSTTEPWGCLSNYNVPDLGVSNGLMDTMEIGSLQLAGSSGIERWLDGESPVN